MANRLRSQTAKDMVLAEKDYYVFEEALNFFNGKVIRTFYREATSEAQLESEIYKRVKIKTLQSNFTYKEGALVTVRKIHTSIVLIRQTVMAIEKLFRIAAAESVQAERMLERVRSTGTNPQYSVKAQRNKIKLLKRALKAVIKINPRLKYIQKQEQKIMQRLAWLQTHVGKTDPVVLRLTGKDESYDRVIANMILSLYNFTNRARARLMFHINATTPWLEQQSRLG